MNRFILIIMLAFAATLATAQRASADDPAPTKEQLDAAKKAYGEGKQLHDAGKLGDAIEKFKESYRLSRNPVLLYNIALTLDENKQTDLALFYYRKFLSDAPQSAGQRKAAADRVQALEKDKLEADLSGKASEPPTKPDVKVEPKTDVKAKIKPAGTYGATDFQHQIIEDAPPGKPLDITASVPQDSGFTVTLFFRGAGDSGFKSKPMRWRYRELVGRIPAVNVAGTSIQYYLEVKDQAGTVVTRSGKSTSPNLVNVDASVQPRFYPDFSDDGSEHATTAETKHHDDEDPINGSHHEEPMKPVVVEPEAPSTPGNGFRDVGSTKFNDAKWASTVSAVALVGLGVTFYFLASKQASSLADDANHTASGDPCMAPCHSFDSYDADIQSAGQRNQTISNVAFGVGAAAIVVAGYFWYRELTGKKHGDLGASATTGSPEATWIIVPEVGDATTRFYGAAAAARF